jgi:hypothetical protein
VGRRWGVRKVSLFGKSGCEGFAIVLWSLEVLCVGRGERGCVRCWMCNMNCTLYMQT